MKQSTLQQHSHLFNKRLCLIFLCLALITIKASAAPLGVPQDRYHPEVRAAIDIRDWHDALLMSHPGVLGSGIGRAEDGSLVIRLFTQRAGIPNLPARLAGIPVQIEVTGPVFALEGEITDPTARFDRPVPVGVSAGHPKITAGTIGARVRDSADNLYALSNNHIFANSNDARVKRDVILQPGPLDGGSSPNDDLGRLHAFVPIDFSGGSNRVDAAIVSIEPGQLSNVTLSSGYGPPGTDIVAAYLGQPVQKCGRTTGCTRSEVSELAVSLDVCYEGTLLVCTKQARFVDQIAISGSGFSSGGDSGSLIVTDDADRSPLALLFAGSSSHTFANPIALVLDSFDVTIDAGSAPQPPAEPLPLSLDAQGYKAKGNQYVDLSWSGSDAARIDLWRDGTLLTGDLHNPGEHTDALETRGKGTYYYQACAAGTDDCSSEISVRF